MGFSLTKTNHHWVHWKASDRGKAAGLARATAGSGAAQLKWMGKGWDDGFAKFLDPNSGLTMD